MFQLQQTLVNEHINELLRDGEALRAARRTRNSDRVVDDDVGGRSGPGGAADRRGVRVRVGHWLIGVGTAVAGRSNGTAGHAA